jgi:hypothetical protein
MPSQTQKSLRKGMLTSAFIMIISFRICVLVVTEGTAGTKMHGIVLTKIDYSTQWACAKLATFRIITK